MDNNTNIKLLDESHIFKASNCLAKGFLREPMAEILKITFQEMLEFCTKVISKAAFSSKLSVVAKHATTGDILGVCINKDLLDSPLKEDDVINEKFYPIFELLDDLDAKYQNKNAVNNKEVLHTIMIVVDSDVKTKNLSSELLKTSFEIAQKKGYKIAMMEATGAISQHIAMNKFGYKEFCSVKYADFIYENITVETNVIHQAYKAGIQNLLFLGSSCIYPRDAQQPIKEEYLLTGQLESRSRWQKRSARPMTLEWSTEISSLKTCSSPPKAA